MMRENHHDRATRRAAKVYALLLRLYPRAHHQAFGEQMLQTFRDQYRDTVVSSGAQSSRFWLDVIGDAGRSLALEYAAILGSLGRRVIDERMGSMKTEAAAVLTVVAGLLVLLGLRVWLSPQLLGAPHGGTTGLDGVAGLALLLVVYALVALLVLLRARAADAGLERAVVLRRATLVGALLGVGVLVAISVDTLGDFESTLSRAVWGVVILAAALGWGVIGLLAARAGSSWRLGLGAALWSGMVSALVGAVGEIATTFLALPSLVQHELSNPDYLAWHQSDVQSYAIASALALGVLGLVLAPVVAGIVGGVASRLGRAGGTPAVLD